MASPLAESPLLEVSSTPWPKARRDSAPIVMNLEEMKSRKGSTLLSGPFGQACIPRSFKTSTLMPKGIHTEKMFEMIQCCQREDKADMNVKGPPEGAAW